MNKEQFLSYKSFMREHAERIHMVSGLAKPPHDLNKVLTFLGADVRYENLKGLEGFVEPAQPLGSGKFVIHVNSQASTTRQRFTIAHEIGHIVLMKHADSVKRQGGQNPLVRYRKWHGAAHCVDATEDPVEEQLCNFFAAELLLPSNQAEAFISRDAVGPDTVLGLADRFRVSLQMAATIVARRLGLNKSAIALWDPSLKWPLPKWHVGLTPTARDREETERLVSETIRLGMPMGQQISGFGRRSQTMYLLTMPTRKSEFILALVCAAAGRAAFDRFQRLPTQLSLW
jgi:hypothetical protein